MAYGTQSVPRVEKIVGPGNVYVAAAKLAVASDVDTDFVAGPSEILVVADGSAPPEFVAADLVSQAEHGPDAASVLVTTSRELASKVQELIEGIIEDNPRKLIVRKALRKYGLVVLAKNMREAVEFSNTYAPEHLVLMVKQPRMLLKRITNAGSVFLGSHSPVAAGDFAVGPNHILPTGGAARRRSGLSVMDFLRLPTVQELSRAGLKRIAGTAVRLAGVEGLPGHARSITERLKRV
ncbi:MAG: histidinol dehydrogenase [Hadesarchaea archaeon]|nr:MAG: histidinol dehydrogenase [Hadesarchaea archaeon]